ncbi:hypothetical protein KAH94_06670, partial [bacterium]|nr:hypothetical protein [bacterium]
MTLISISKGNTKLSKNIASFSIPPVSTCPNAGDCAKYCYAKKAYRLYTNTTKAYDKNLLASKKDYFIDLMVDEIKALKQKVFRLHVSGDFYNQEYFNKWVAIINHHPETKFYTYTKTFWLDLKHKPKNLTLIYSYGGRMDKGEAFAINKGFDGVASIQESESIAPEAKTSKGFKVCREKCGTNCNYCFNKGSKFKKVAFLKH